MSLSLALQASAVYALALLLSRAGSAVSRRAVLIAACALVAALPLFALAPGWSSPAAPEVFAAAAALQEPSVGDSGAAAPAGARMPAPGAALGWIWGIGVAFAAARMVADLMAVRRLRASARRDGEVVISDQIEVPVVVGALRPLVLLPADAAGWEAERLALVMAHERAHARGRDNLWLLLAQAAACLHWFNPLAWRVTAALRDACEHRADEVVLEGGADAAEYAHTLIALARRRAPRAAFAMARPSGLERRVRAVLGWRPVTGGGAALRVGLLASLAIGTATADPVDRSTLSVAGAGSAVLEAEADYLMATYKPEGVALVLMDARSGVVLAQAGRGDLLARPVGVGSVIKPFLAVAALEAGASVEQPFTDGDMGSILERSSNVGTSAMAAWAGREAVVDVFERVGLPAPEGVPLEKLAMGEGVLVTPEQVARAWTHLAGGGVIAPEIAASLRELLVVAVEGEQATGKAAAVPGVRVAGKTGTAPLVRADGTVDPERYLASFIGLVPAEAPEWILLVSVAGPQSEQSWGGVVAAPSFRRVVEAL